MTVATNIFSRAYEWFNNLTELVSDFSANWWFILVIFAVAYLDSIIPAVPSETLVIIGGIAAGQGNQNLLLVIAVGLVGAFLGDLTAYFIGGKLSSRIERIAARRPKFNKRLDWAAKQIRLRGGQLLITARFIPGGRTAVTLSSGITHQPRRWFIRWTAIAVTIWAVYAALLGALGGAAFKDDHNKAFIVAFATALVANVVVEAVRHFSSKHTDEHHADPDPDPDLAPAKQTPAAAAPTEP